MRRKWRLEKLKMRLEEKFGALGEKSFPQPKKVGNALPYLNKVSDIAGHETLFDLVP